MGPNLGAFNFAKKKICPVSFGHVSSNESQEASSRRSFAADRQRHKLFIGSKLPVSSCFIIACVPAPRNAKEYYQLNSVVSF